MSIFRVYLFSLALLALVASCVACKDTITDTPTAEPDCTEVATIADLSDRGACNETLPYSNEVSIVESGDQRIITSNAIPDHKVGLFGGGQGSLNPNAIAPVQDRYSIPLTPSLSGTVTKLLSSNGPQYEFGVMLNGVLMDPEAAEPWPHDGIFSFSTKNWDWNLDAMSINLGLDCNNAHVQPSGKYHHHGKPSLYLESLNLSSDEMSLIGYAADGFPVYYLYGYEAASDAGSSLIELNSSFQLKTGERPGDGDSAPCGTYTGIYTNDYEYVAGLGELDECNGRSGVTPEFPGGTYYYVITETFPFLPRCLKGTPSDDFRLGR